VTDKIQIGKILPKNAVRNVREETPSERFFRRIGDSSALFVACSVTIIGFGLLWLVLFSDNQYLVKYKDAAWSLIAAIIGAASGFMFSKRT
jgi:hypothetical protein